MILDAYSSIISWPAPKPARAGSSFKRGIKMSGITKLNLYLSELQFDKLRVLAEQKDVSPEQAANEILYSYLAMIDPMAMDAEDTED